MPLKRRRIVMRIICLLAVGAALNVAVAWGLAATMQVDRRKSDAAWSERYLHLGHYQQKLIRRYDSFGTTRVAGAGWSNTGPKPPETAESICPDWCDYSRDFTYSAGLFQGIALHASGWPCRTALFRFRNEYQTIPIRLEIIDGIRLPDFKASMQQIGGSNFYTLRALPLHPIWPGFAVNTVFYAGVLWMLFVLPFALRRMIRRRRGRCAHCAYPIGTSPVCTECGGTVTPRRGAGL